MFEDNMWSKSHDCGLHLSISLSIYPLSSLYNLFIYQSIYYLSIHLSPIICLSYNYCLSSCLFTCLPMYIYHQLSVYPSWIPAIVIRPTVFPRWLFTSTLWFFTNLLTNPYGSWRPVCNQLFHTKWPARSTGVGTLVSCYTKLSDP